MGLSDFPIGSFPKGAWPDRAWPDRAWPKAPGEEEAPSIPSDDLEHTPSYILGFFLIAENVVTLPRNGSAWPLYKSHLPDGDNAEDNAGAIYDTTPVVDERVHTGSHNIHYGLQILIRSVDYEAGKMKAETLFSTLQNIQNENISFDDYVYEVRTINPVTGIISLGLEPGTKRRYFFSLNFLTVLKRMVAA